MTTYPPGGWSANDGTWGTDMDRETSIVHEGANAVKFISTATASSRVISDYYPVVPGEPYKTIALLRADNVTGKSVSLTTRWFTEAKATISSSVILNAALPAINTWYEIASIIDAPATANFARVIVGRNTASFNAYSAFARLVPHPVCFSAYLDANTVYANAATIVFDVENFDYGSNYATGTGIFTTPADGVYLFEATALLADLAAGDDAYLQLEVNGSAKRYGQRTYVHALNDDPILSITAPVLLSRGDTVEIAIRYNYSGGGGNRTVSGDIAGALYTAFSGFRVE